MGEKSATIVETASGALRGFVLAGDESVRVYRGIPFAQPPTGELRWRPPVTDVAWDGIRDASAFGPPCWQTGGNPETLYYKPVLNVSEDCLYLNLWTAAESSTERRPVMVWFHGGGNVNGTGSTPNFDGTAHALMGAVVITINYRLGPFGFLAHPGLTAESGHHASGNYGLLDQIAALQWVQKNISAFGGDPDRVMIFGQSAGSWDVGALMVSPLAKGLFHRAVGQSGQFLSGVRSLDEAPPNTDPAHVTGIKAAATLGVEGDDRTAIKKLRAMDASIVFDAMRQIVSGYPIIDGWVIPDSPRALYARGEFHQVPVIIGTMAHETNLLAVSEQDTSSVETAVKERFGTSANRILEAYAESIDQSPVEALAEILTDSRQTLMAREWASMVANSGGDVYLYYFSHRPPVYRIYESENLAMETPKGLRSMGAYHSGDLVYVFGNVRRTNIDWAPHDHVVSDVVSRYWASFAADGDPNGEGLQPWPRFTMDSQTTMVIGDEIRAAPHPRSYMLGAFAPQ